MSETNTAEQPQVQDAPVADASVTASAVTPEPKQPFSIDDEIDDELVSIFNSGNGEVIAKKWVELREKKRKAYHEAQKLREERDALKSAQEQAERERAQAEMTEKERLQQAIREREEELERTRQQLELKSAERARIEFEYAAEATKAKTDMLDYLNYTMVQELKAMSAEDRSKFNAKRWFEIKKQAHPEYFQAPPAPVAPPAPPAPPAPAPAAVAQPQFPTMTRASNPEPMVSTAPIPLTQQLATTGLPVQPAATGSATPIVDAKPTGQVRALESDFDAYCRQQGWK